MKRLFALLLVPLFLFSASVYADAPKLDQPLMLVAKPELQEFYAGSVIYVRPTPNGGHVGIIVNKPTPVTLGKLFPDHAPSLKVARPILLGGPEQMNAVFAVVNRNPDGNGSLMPLADGVSLAMSSDAVDAIIEADGDNARYYVGMVIWQPGELAAEFEKGFWFARAVDATLIFSSDPTKTWGELMEKIKYENPGTGDPKTGVST